MNSPVISVLMTSFNREGYISEAIESVLSSSFENFELIIVDDCSSDHTVEIAKGFEDVDNRVKVYVNEKNLGDYPNRNKAASYARGKYIKYVDADDVLYYFGLEVMYRFAEKFPEAGFCLGAYPDDDRPFPILVKPREIYLEHFYKYGHFDRAPGSGLIKKEAFDTVGGFSGKRMIGDYEFWFKISRYFSMVKVPIDTYWNRLHDGQESKTDYARKNYFRLRNEVLEEALKHPDCPLRRDELKTLYMFLRRKMYKERIFRAISKFKKAI